MRGAILRNTAKPCRPQAYLTRGDVMVGFQIAIPIIAVAWRKSSCAQFQARPRPGCHSFSDAWRKPCVAQF